MANIIAIYLYFTIFLPFCPEVKALMSVVFVFKIFSQLYTILLYNSKKGVIWNQFYLYSKEFIT